MSSSHVPQLPPLSDPGFIECFQKAKDKKALWDEFYRLFKNLEIVRNGSTEKKNVTQMIAILINNSREQDKKHKKYIQGESEKFDKCKKDHDDTKHDNERLSASVISKDAMIEEYKMRCANLQSKIDKLLSDAAKKAAVGCDKCGKLQQQIDQCQQRWNQLNADLEKMCDASAGRNEREKLLEEKIKELETAGEVFQKENTKLYQKVEDLTQRDKTRDLLLKNVQDCCDKQKSELEKKLTEALEKMQKLENDKKDLINKLQTEYEKAAENDSRFHAFVKKTKEDDKRFKAAKNLMDEIMCNREEAKKLYVKPSSDSNVEQQKDQVRFTSGHSNLPFQESLDMGPLARKRIRLALSPNFTASPPPRNTESRHTAEDVENEQQENQVRWSCRRDNYLFQEQLGENEPPSKRRKTAPAFFSNLVDLLNSSALQLNDGQAPADATAPLSSVDNTECFGDYGSSNASDDEESDRE